MKASGKSSFTTFVDLGMYQPSGGTGDDMSVGGMVLNCLKVTGYLRYTSVQLVLGGIPVHTEYRCLFFL